ncbi:hypothetical protein [Paenibacillus sp. FSL H3-0333]|uniref:hypothetical protein n=1 Tax=Paenibacillus sp. FSL H3-0333 TaxID=2921373 RepID=UPI0030F6A075
MKKEPGVQRSNYQEVKNHIHNELGITKEYVQELIKELVQEEVKKLINSNYIDHLVEKDINHRVGKTYGRGFGSNFENNVRGIIAKEVGRMLVEDMKITIGKSDKAAQVNVSSFYMEDKTVTYGLNEMKLEFRKERGMVMEETKTYSIAIASNQQLKAITFKELYEDILNEIDSYKELGTLDELMNQKVRLSLLDANGKVIEGAATLAVGWLENGDVLITGGIEGVYE